MLWFVTIEGVLNVSLWPDSLFNCSSCCLIIVDYWVGLPLIALIDSVED